MDALTRAQIAAEIVALTLPPEQSAEEITVAEYQEAAARAGRVITERQAQHFLEAAVKRGEMARRKVGPRVFYRRLG